MQLRVLVYGATIWHSDRKQRLDNVCVLFISQFQFSNYGEKEIFYKLKVTLVTGHKGLEGE